MRTRRFLLAGIAALMCALLLPLSSARGAAWDVVPIDWGSFRSAAPSDTVSVRERGLLRMANKFTLNLWWRQQGYADQGGTYLDFGTDPEEADVRPAAAAAFSLAVALQTGAYSQSVTGVTAADAKAKAIKLLSSVALVHRANTPASSTKDWGAGWQPAYWAMLAATAGWMLWDDLSSEDAERVRKMIEFECNWLKDRNVPFYQRQDGSVVFSYDSKSEENWWNATTMTTCVSMMPNHPTFDDWMDKAIEYGVSMFARPADVNSATSYHGRPLSVWLKGSNIFDDGTLVNHRRMNVAYMAINGFNAFPFALAGESIPSGVLRGGQVVYKTLAELPFPYPTPWNEPVVTNPDGNIYTPAPNADDFEVAIHFPEGADWGNELYNFVLTDAYADVLGWDSTSTLSASYWEDLHSSGQSDMQNRWTDGHTFTSGENRYDGIEADAARVYAETYLAKWLDAQGAIATSNTSYLPSAGTLTPGGYNDDDLNVTYDVPTDWSRWHDTRLYGAQMTQSDVRGRSYSFTYDGTRARLYSVTAPDGGRAEVYVDGVYKRDIDFYSASAAWSQEVYDTDDDRIGAGTHRIEVRVKHTKHASSTGYWVFSDEIVVDGVMTAGTYDDEHDYVVYGRERLWDTTDGYWVYGKVDWNDGPGGSNHAGGMEWTGSRDYSATFTYNGSRARFYGRRLADGGKADVYVDGVHKATIDYYNATSQYQQLMFDTNTYGIGRGTHTVEIVVKGESDPRATWVGGVVTLDKVVIS